MNISRKISIALMFSCTVSFTGITFAENAQESSEKPVHLKKRLTDKYKIDEVSSSLQQTPHGPLGHLGIIGEMKPDEVPVVEGKHGLERGVARGLLKQESELFGITDIDEIQERLVNSSNGYYGEIINIYMHRIVNGIEVENSAFILSVDAIRNVSYVAAEVVPSPPEMYEATKKKALSDQKITEIIEKNLMVSGIKKKNIDIRNLKKFATYLPPYVVWTAEAYSETDFGRWLYRINAFTGEILYKDNVIIH